MKIKFGSLVVDGRGKIGGHVASKNRGGAYLRTKVTPINPQTSFQNAVRSRITTFSQGWKGLTQAQRNAWNGAVSDFQKTDIFGDIKKPSGLNLYVKLNANILEVGGTAIVLPPLPTSVFAPETLALSAAAGTPTFAMLYSPIAPPTDVKYVIRTTPQLSAGKSFVKNQYRNLLIADSGASSPINLLAAYTARFGTLVAGLKISVEVLAIDSITGIKSSPISTSVIIAA